MRENWSCRSINFESVKLKGWILAIRKLMFPVKPLYMHYCTSG